MEEYERKELQKLSKEISNMSQDELRDFILYKELQINRLKFHRTLLVVVILVILAGSLNLLGGHNPDCNDYSAYSTC